MLALSLLACQNLGPDRTWDCGEGHNVLYVKSPGALDAAVVPDGLDGKCASTPTDWSPARTWVLAPYDPRTPIGAGEPTDVPGDTGLAPDDGDALTTPAMLLTTRSAAYEERFTSYRFDWGAEPGELTSIYGPRGITVLARGEGYAAIQTSEDGSEVLVRCNDCDVTVTNPPRRLTLKQTRGTAHLCLRGTERVTFDLVDSSIDVTLDAPLPDGMETLTDGNQAIVRGVANPPFARPGITWSADPGGYCGA